MKKLTIALLMVAGQFAFAGPGDVGSAAIYQCQGSGGYGESKMPYIIAAAYDDVATVTPENKKSVQIPFNQKSTVLSEEVCTKWGNEGLCVGIDPYETCRQKCVKKGLKTTQVSLQVIKGGLGIQVQESNQTKTPGYFKDDVYNSEKTYSCYPGYVLALYNEDNFVISIDGDIVVGTKNYPSKQKDGTDIYGRDYKTLSLGNGTRTQLTFGDVVSLEKSGRFKLISAKDIQENYAIASAFTARCIDNTGNQFEYILKTDGKNISILNTLNNYEMSGEVVTVAGASKIAIKDSLTDIKKIDAKTFTIKDLFCRVNN